jgi:hypothetical protein
MLLLIKFVRQENCSSIIFHTHKKKKKIIDAISCQEPALNTQKSLQKQRCLKSGVVFSIHPAIINLCDTTSTHDAPAVDKKH